MCRLGPSPVSLEARATRPGKATPWAATSWPRFCQEQRERPCQVSPGVWRPRAGVCGHRDCGHSEDRGLAWLGQHRKGLDPRDTSLPDPDSVGDTVLFRTWRGPRAQPGGSLPSPARLTDHWCCHGNGSLDKFGHQIPTQRPGTGTAVGATGTDIPQECAVLVLHARHGSAH